MSLTDAQKTKIAGLVKDSLDDAESVWDTHNPIFEAATEGIGFDRMAKRAEVVPSKIPGHPSLSSDHSVVAEYVCLVADIRGSSNHLLNAISSSKESYSCMKRVYFETAALLPALDQTIQFCDGSVTEYLGDGVLALFSVEPGEREKREKREKTIRNAYRAAKNCIGDTRDIVNSALFERYRIPYLDLGVGLAFSDAIVQLVGVPGRMHPKVLGPCVYYASKLCYEKNAIVVHKNLKLAWPKSKGGKLSFLAVEKNGVEGFKLT